jgi:hypothetical protein
MIFPAMVLSALAGLLTGCQHEMPKQVERPGMAAIGRPIYDAQATAHLQKAIFIRDVAVKPTAEVADTVAPQPAKPAAPVNAGAKKAADSLTLQLGDCLLGMLQMSTGH